MTTSTPPRPAPPDGDRRRAALGGLATRRVGLVLGAGGTTGIAFHSGTLLALSNDFGWDPREAAAIVGTSAGSVVASLLRGGLSTDDLASWSASVASAAGGDDFRAVLEEAERLRPTLARPTWRRRWRLGPILTPTLTLPGGLIDASAGLSRMCSINDGWPQNTLWINAVRQQTLRRVVFGRDLLPDIGAAVAASCAIPGLFAPVRIGRHTYLDGAVHSATNADVLRGTDLETVLVLSPMSIRPGAARNSIDHALRLNHGHRLRRECRALSAAGIDVHLFEPDEATLKAMGRNTLSRARAGGVVRESFLSATA